MSLILILVNYIMCIGIAALGGHFIQHCTLPGSLSHIFSFFAEAFTTLIRLVFHPEYFTDEMLQEMCGLANRSGARILGIAICVLETIVIIMPLIAAILSASEFRRGYFKDPLLTLGASIFLSFGFLVCWVVCTGFLGFGVIDFEDIASSLQQYGMIGLAFVLAVIVSLIPMSMSFVRVFIHK